MEKIFRNYVAGTCSPEEYRQVIEFIQKAENNQAIGEQMKRVWTRFSYVKDDLNNSELLDRIHHQIALAESRQNQKKLKTYRMGLQVAAVLIVGLIVTSIWNFGRQQSASCPIFMQEISTPLASRTSFLLPDGSKVWLNAASVISFPSSFDSHSRTVKLSGEAFFDVKKDKVPFKVETSGFTVNVLGTAFNVMAYQGEQASVTLERGRVELKRDKSTLGTLLPGQQASFSSDQDDVKIQQVDPSLISAWKENRLIFQEEPLEILAKRLERWYNLKITIEDKTLNRLKVTGKIELESFSEVLDLMELTLPINYRYNKDERTLTIYKK